MDDILAARYATKQMAQIWTTQYRQQLERELWLDAMLSHHEHGWPVTLDDIEAYRLTAEHVDPELIASHEEHTRHQTAAHIRAWNSLAGRQKLHLGMTSSDVGAMVDRLRCVAATELVEQRINGLLLRLVDLADHWRDWSTIGRTHNQPAQTTTIGRRYAMWADQLLRVSLAPALPVRPLLGAIGTGIDLHAMTAEPGTAPTRAPELIPDRLAAPGQGYPYALESITWGWCAALGQIASSVAVTLRLEAGQDLWTETKTDGQVGSSAMPHKTNPRHCEQIHGLNLVLQGMVSIANNAASDQWYEGDVSTSAARRVYLPGIWLSVDAILNTLMWVLVEGQHDAAAAARAVDRRYAELNSGRRVAALVRDGLGREDAHQKVASDPAVTNPGVDQLPGTPLGYAQLQVDQVVEAIRDDVEVPDCEWQQPN